MSDRAFNFSPGPAALPLPVLEQAQRELLALPGAGASVLEISHRSSHFKEILADAKERLKQLLGVPDSHRILFLQGGARLQFSMIPLNLLRDSGRSADYIMTGSWSIKAAEEAHKEGEVHYAWDGAAEGHVRTPSNDELQLSPGAAYVHFTSNETIQGVQFLDEPEVGERPLVCDASSDLLCRPLPVERYGLIYACAQKNLGPAGVTVVIIREDLAGRGSDRLPGYLNYRLQVEGDSAFNTPNTFGVYMVGLVAKWLQDEIGGLEKMYELNRQKADLLYAAIDQSDGFYRPHARPESRSIMNVVFRLPSDELQAKFLAGAAERGLINLKGHRSVGGIRASIYNAMPLEGVERLDRYMREFQQQNAE